MLSTVRHPAVLAAAVLVGLAALPARAPAQFGMPISPFRMQTGFPIQTSFRINTGIPLNQYYALSFYSALANRLAYPPFAYNPYLPMWPTMAYPTAYPNTYPGGYGPYSMSPYAMYPPYSYQSYMSSDMGNVYGQYAMMPYVGPYDIPPEGRADTALAAIRRYGGGLDWPIGLRSVQPSDEAGRLRKEIDADVETILRQSSDSPVNPEVVRRVAADLEKLQQLYAKWVQDSALRSQQRRDAGAFLQKAQDALKAVQQRPAKGQQPAQLYSR